MGGASGIDGIRRETGHKELSNRRCCGHGPDVDDRCFVDVNVDWARVFVRLVLDRKVCTYLLSYKIRHPVLKLEVSTLQFSTRIFVRDCK